MIDPKKVIQTAGYLPSPELEAALNAELEKIANKPAFVDRVFKRLYRKKDENPSGN